MAENATQKMIREAQEHASAVCRDAYAITPEKYRRYITLIKQSKKLADRVYAPIELPYTCVDGRVKMALDEHREAKKAIRIENEIENVDGQWMIKTTVTSELLGYSVARSPVNLGGKGVDASNPWENAETSSLGRALGFLGYGLLGTGIASYEEMQSALGDEGDAEPKAYVMPQGKRELLSSKLRDLGHSEEKIDEILASMTNAGQVERAIAKAVSQWEAKAAAAEAVLGAPAEGEPDDIPDSPRESPWDSIFAAMKRVGVEEDVFEAYLLKDYGAKVRGITSARDLQANAVVRYRNLTDTEEKAKQLANAVMREMAKAK